MEDRESFRFKQGRKIPLGLLAGPDLPGHDRGLKGFDQCHPRIGIGLQPRAAHLGGALAHDVGRGEDAPTRRVQGIRPAVAGIHQVL